MRVEEEKEIINRKTSIAYKLKEVNNLKKKLALFLCLFSVCMCLAGCQHKHDTIEICNKSDWIYDNVTIETKDGYFYESHEKLTVDENTIAITIYFSTSEKDVWDDKSE